MDEFIVRLNEWGSVNGGILALIGTIGLLITVIQFFRKDSISLKYLEDSNVLIQDFKKDYSLLEVKYNGKEVRNLTSTRLLIFNAGNVTLRYSDFPQGEVFGVKAKGEYEILDAGIVDEISDSCFFKIEPIDNKTQKILFNHINSKNAVLLHILHTGKSFSGLELIGKGAGFKKVSLSLLDKDIYSILFGATAMTALFLGLGYYLFFEANPSVIIWVLGTVSSALGIALCVPTVGLYFELKNYLWLRKILKKL